MNDILRIARHKIALQRAFLGRAILRVIKYGGNKNQGWSGGLKYKHFPVSLSNKTFP